MGQADQQTMDIPLEANHRLLTSFSSVSTGGPLFIEGSLGSTKLNDQP